MKNPFAILKVADTATDADIQKAYLRAVREHPPEREPERFQEIRTAFETLKTQRDRLHYQLFHNEPPELENLLRPWLHTGVSQRRPTEEQLRKLIASSLLSE